MNDKLRIEIQGNIAQIYSPYNSDFSKQLSFIEGAHLDTTKEYWIVPKSAVPAVREIMRNIYGLDDKTYAETVNVRLTIKRQITNLRKDINFCGKCLCHAFGRDSKAKAGTDVVYIKGNPRSGGSVKNWECIVPEEAVIYVSNVDKELLKNAENDNMEIEILPSEEEYDRKVLLKERQELERRMEEIDRLLNEFENEEIKK